MEKVQREDLEGYDPPGHFKMTALKMHGKEATGAEDLWMGLSHFLPGGGAEMSSSDSEKIYYVLEGTLLIETPDGEETVIEENDSILIPPGSERSLVNPTNDTATMLVVGTNG